MTQNKYNGVICRGCWALGTACGKCEKCIDTKLFKSSLPPVSSDTPMPDVKSPMVAMELVDIEELRTTMVGRNIGMKFGFDGGCNATLDYLTANGYQLIKVKK